MSKSAKFNQSSGNKYDTLKEAIAFCDGVQYANDSALNLVGVRETPTGYEVLMWDEDAKRTNKTYRVNLADLAVEIQQS